MFKHLFPTLLIPVLLLGAGCAKQDSNTGTAQQPAQEVQEAGWTFEDGTYMVAPATETRTASSIGWTASKRVGPTHTGTVDVQEAAIVMAQDQIIGGSVVIDMSTIMDLDLQDPKFNTMLVNHLKSEDFFNVAAYPTATFALSEATPAQGAQGTHQLSGTMTIKGIEQEVSFPATVVPTEQGIEVTGTLVLDRTLWDVRFGSDKFFDNLGDGLIEDEFTLLIDLLFTLPQ